jgi:superfamily II DNA or RNA helicase
MVFKRRTPAAPVPEDPEQLYRVLAQTSSGPPALWLHQGDVLRSWYREHRDHSDVAIELPTGAGKTLVGGILWGFKTRHRD